MTWRDRKPITSVSDLNCFYHISKDTCLISCLNLSWICLWLGSILSFSSREPLHICCFLNIAFASVKSPLKHTVCCNFFQSCFHFLHSSFKSSAKPEGGIPVSFSLMQSTKVRTFPYSYHSTGFWGFLYHQGGQIISFYDLSFLTPECITGCQTSSLFVCID